MATHNDTAVANKAAVYTVVFEVDLTTPDAFSAPNVNGNQTQADLAKTRSTWIPFGEGHESGGNRNEVLKHGEQFTAYDDEAYYLKAKYVRSASNPNGVLKVVSETL